MSAFPRSLVGIRRRFVETPAAVLRRHAVTAVGGLFLAVAGAYAVGRGGRPTALLLETALPVLVGLALLWYGTRHAADDEGVRRPAVVAASTLVWAGVGTSLVLWTVLLARLRMGQTGDVAQLGVLAWSVGGGAGAVVGHFYASLSATHRERERLTRAIDNSLEGVAIIEDGTHVYANDAYADLYGYPSPALLEGEPWRPLYVNESIETIKCEVVPALQERTYWRGSLTGSRVDGTTFPKEVTASVVEDGYVVVVRDVSVQRQREQRIQVLNRVLRHNLRNTFTVIQGHANLVAERAPELEDDHVDPIREEIGDLLTTADKARGVERSLARHGEERPIEPSAAVRRTVDRATAAHPEATVRSRVEESGLAPVDAGITDALNELVDNAVEHADSPDPTVEVCVRSVERGDGERVEFAVVDDGPGIPEADRSAVLEGEETPLAHGSGLGLWLVNWIVRNAGGELSFDEPPGGGTEVTIAFVEDGSRSREAVGELATA